jgi:ABC-type protease/lipase transport system fused ATPase/permease subunit
VHGGVQFHNVTFSYQGASSPALKDVSFEVPPGTTLGLVGRSGSGKTTVTRMLQRFHPNYEGLIKVDGVDLREYDLDHVRRNLGVVLQENFLFSGTIRENIAAAKPDATFDDVVRAARLAGAEESIDRLPRGFETFIYEAHRTCPVVSDSGSPLPARSSLIRASSSSMRRPAPSTPRARRSSTPTCRALRMDAVSSWYRIGCRRW